MEGKALGRGLAALIPERMDKKEEMVAFIKTELIGDNKFQPRTNFSDDKFNELKASIKEKGILQPILVREKEGGFEVIAGERRLKAARALNIENVPAIVKKVTDQEALVIALIENIQREELNPIEEAEAYKRLIEEFNFSHEAIAQSVGKERSTISNLLRLLKLSSEIQKSIYIGQLSMGHARALLSLEIPAERDHLFSLAVKKGLSVRELENMVKTIVGGGSRREKIKKTKGHEVLALEEELQKVLGTKVRIVMQKKRGKIVIEYYSFDDMDRIIRLIGKARQNSI